MLKAFRTSKASLSSSGRFAVSSLPSKIRVHGDRSYATEAVFMSIPPAKAITTSRDPEGPLRPHLGVEVNPNHGLWAFFRKTAGKDGVESHETVEKKDSVVHYSGRAWTASELRRKSFKDLHTLWYVVLRERNLLETQVLESKRLGVFLESTPATQRMFRCRKTMARIKYIINERRLAYEGAVQIIAEGKEPRPEVLVKEAPKKTTVQERVQKPSNVEGPPVAPQETAAERAASGLLGPNL